jgi:hypothetical protein
MIDVQCGQVQSRLRHWWPIYAVSGNDAQDHFSAEGAARRTRELLTAFQISAQIEPTHAGHLVEARDEIDVAARDEETWFR